MWHWAQEHQALFWWVCGSLALGVLTPLVAAWLVIRLPTDYFVTKKRKRAAWWQRQPWLRPVVIVLKNAVGVLLLVAGVVMLVAPGQGLLTIAVGLILVDFPGKYRLERWLVTRPAVWRSLNWLRKHARREPLQRPG